MRRDEESPSESLAERASRELIQHYVTPRWRRHLERILERERDVDAVVVFTVPMSHLRGIPTALRERFNAPVVYYDADVPMSLPEYGGMDTGFNIYHGADPSEYDLVLSNSEGGLDRLRELGAKRAEALFWGADPELFAPLPVEKEHDVFFYAYGDKFRRNWMGELIGEPSRRLPDADFALGGTDFHGDVGRARELGYFPVNLLSRMISASKINLNVARKPHAEVYASSTSRLFELAAAGAAIVTNPYEGIERWFEPGRELLVVSSADEATEAYRTLLDDPGAAAELGRRARERVLEEHTFADRARRLLELVGVRSPSKTAVT
jgi:spore maturation protein CgeB